MPSNDVSNRREHGKFTDSSRRHDSASVQAVVMPCCGTTRQLHDDIGPGAVKRRCNKCNTLWGVTYLGAGRFKFEFWSDVLKLRRKALTTCL